MSTTNAVDTFITVSPGTRATAGVAPPPRDPPSQAARLHALITAAPYALSSDEALFTAWADERGLAPEAREAARARFFSVIQPDLRSSHLTRSFGWGVHHDAAGHIALIGMETAAYARLAAGVGPRGEPVTVVRALRACR
jgi:hypothetical protein